MPGPCFIYIPSPHRGPIQSPRPTLTEAKRSFAENFFAPRFSAARRNVEGLHVKGNPDGFLSHYSSLRNLKGPAEAKRSFAESFFAYFSFKKSREEATAASSSRVAKAWGRPMPPASSAITPASTAR